MWGRTGWKKRQLFLVKNVKIDFFSSFIFGIDFHPGGIQIIQERLLDLSSNDDEKLCKCNDLFVTVATGVNRY